MTVTTTIAHCPRCGSVESIYIRDGDHESGVDNLVCRSQSCREGVTPQAPTERLPSSRQLFGRRRP